MSNQQTFVIESEPDLGAASPKLHGIAQWPKTPAGGADRWPTVVICHGFKGFLEWGFFPPLARLLVDRGFTVIRFNFSGSGMQPGDESVTDLAAFRTNTFSLELRETLRIMQAAGTEIAPGRADPDRMALVGHSRGGGAALLAAAHQDWQDRLRALITWAGVGTFDRYRDPAIEDAWRRDGAFPIRNARTGQDLELGVELLDDLMQNGSELELAAAAARRRAPWLIVHGAEDETVPSSEAQSLDRAAADPRELSILDGANHTFGAKHPFAGPTRELTTAMNATQTWLRRHLC